MAYPHRYISSKTLLSVVNNSDNDLEKNTKFFKNIKWVRCENFQLFANINFSLFPEIPEFYAALNKIHTYSGEIEFIKNTHVLFYLTEILLSINDLIMKLYSKKNINNEALIYLTEMRVETLDSINDYVQMHNDISFYNNEKRIEESDKEFEKMQIIMRKRDDRNFDWNEESKIMRSFREGNSDDYGF